MGASFEETSIEYLKGVGPKRAELLAKGLNIKTFGDLLVYYPYRYIDRSVFNNISDIDIEQSFVQLKGRIVSLETIGKNRAMRLVATFRDNTGDIELVWFQGIKWVKEKIKANTEYIVFGRPTLFNRKFNIAHPEIEEVTPDKANTPKGLQPLYSSTEKLRINGLDSRGISRLTRNLIDMLKGNINETLPDYVLQKIKCVSREEALINIHFPENNFKLEKARNRLKFDELFFIQLRLIMTKILRSKKILGNKFTIIGDVFNDFYHKHLPFELTNAQKKVIKEIRADVGTGKQMNRLLQGDVGSGKTLVALMTILMAIDNGYQTCLMAPTEILAVQHFETITKMLDNMNVYIELLTGSTKTAKRKKIYQDLLMGDIKILIGTHALIEDSVQFKNLGIVVIDEQHRFGVAQRASMWKKNVVPPHILVMTATPIPRTLAMTLYGDLDYSVIDELPPGRKPVKTYHYYDSARLKVFGFMKQKIKEGRQIYVVYPIINESESLDLKYLMDGYESISRAFPLPEYAVSVVHGQMKSAAREYEMQRFVKGETQIMVATTVIEVGVDIPNASIMIIENAERFGLSQLHQLRGRVGRGSDQSYCILMSGYKLTADGKKRLETMVKTTDGFVIAEADLKLRGPGDLQGTQQSGIIDLRLSDLAKDEKIVKYARKIAEEILEEDSDLSLEKNCRILFQLKILQSKSENWSLIS